MKSLKKAMKLLAWSLVMCLIFSIQIPASAKDYSYTVRFFAGKQGSFNENAVNNLTVVDSKGKRKEVNVKDLSGNDLESGVKVEREKDGSALVISNLTAGDRVSFNNNLMSLNNGKYYIKGIRESGKDNNTVGTFNMSSISVNSDADYVVAYGILGDSVAYTVNYVDTEGNELIPSETYYGNIGDSIVVAFVYIEGYFPQAYNLGRTLSSDPSQNVFTFVYTRIGGTALEGPGAGEGTNFGPGEGGAGGEGGGGVGPGGEVIDENNPPLDEGPSDFDNLDDEDTPLGNLDGLNDGPLFGLDALQIPLAGKIAIGAGALAVIILALWFALMAKKKKEEDE